MSDQWHYLKQGKQTGPVSGAELKQLASSGVLSPSDMVWKDGMASWVPAEKVKGLFTASSGAPVPPSLLVPSPLLSVPEPVTATAAPATRSGVVPLLALVGGGGAVAGVLIGLLLGWMIFAGRGSPVNGLFSSVPTEAEARKIIEKRYEEDVATGYIKIVSIRKTDGVAGEDTGVKTYTMWCDLEVEFQKDWKSGGLEADKGGEPRLNCVHAATPVKSEYKKGDRIKIKTVADFMKTEKGWTWSGP